MQWILPLLILACCTTLGLAIASMQRRRPTRQRLLRLRDGTRAVRPASEGPGLLAEDVPAWILRFLRPLAGRSGDQAERGPDQLRRRMIESGYRRPSAPVVFMGGRIALAIALPLLALLVPGTWHFEEFQLVAVLAVATGAGYLAPSHLVDRRRKARQRAIELGLPDALDLMVVCVQAGLGILASIDRVVKDLPGTHPVLCAEFELSLYEIRAGKSTVAGLRGLAERTGVSEVSTLVAMLVQTERFGTSVADTLRVHADALRTRRMQRAEELANKAPLMMLFPTTLIFAATLVVTIGPAVLEITSFFREID